MAVARILQMRVLGGAVVSQSRQVCLIRRSNQSGSVPQFRENGHDSDEGGDHSQNAYRHCEPKKVGEIHNRQSDASADAQRR